MLRPILTGITALAEKLLLAIGFVGNERNEKNLIRLGMVIAFDEINDCSDNLAAPVLKTCMPALKQRILT